MAENVKKFQTFDGVEHDIEDTTAREGLNNVYTKSEADALLAGKVDSDEVYSKAVLNAILDSKADEDNVYSKTATDDLLAAKANAADVYTKTEADTALALKADAADVYTKTEADTLLGSKANSADVYTITQADALLDAKADLDDSSTTSTVATWSADKLHTEFQNYAKLNSTNTFKVYQKINSNGIDTTDTPSETIWGDGISFDDKNDVRTSYIAPSQNTDGSVDIRINSVNGKVLLNSSEVTPVLKNFTTSSALLWNGTPDSYTITEDGWYQMGIALTAGTTGGITLCSDPTFFSGVPRGTLLGGSTQGASYRTYYLTKGTTLYKFGTLAGLDLYKMS